MASKLLLSDATAALSSRETTTKADNEYSEQATTTTKTMWRHARYDDRRLMIDVSSWLATTRSASYC